MTQPADDSTKCKISNSEKVFAFFMGAFLTYYCYKIAMFFAGSACEKKGSTDSGQKMRVVGILLLILLVKGCKRFNINDERAQPRLAGDQPEKKSARSGKSKKSKKESKILLVDGLKENKKKGEVRSLEPEEGKEEVKFPYNDVFLKLKLKLKLKPSLMMPFFCFYSSLISLGFFVGSWASGIDDFSLMVSELAFSFCFSYALSFLGSDGVFLASFPQAFFGTFYFFSALIDGVVLEGTHLFSAVFAFCACQYIRVSGASDRQEEKDRAENVFFATSCMTFVLSLSAKKNRSIVYEVQRTLVFLIIFSFLGQRLLLGRDKGRGLSRPDKDRGDEDVWAPWRVFLGEVKKAFIKRKLSFMVACFLTYVVFSLNVGDLKKYQDEFSEVIAEGLQESYVYAILIFSCLSCLVFYRRDLFLKAFGQGGNRRLEQRKCVPKTREEPVQSQAAEPKGKKKARKRRQPAQVKKVVRAAVKGDVEAEAKAAPEPALEPAKAVAKADGEVEVEAKAAPEPALEPAQAAAKAAPELALEPATATAPELEPEPELALEPAQAAVVQAQVVEGEAIEPEASQGPANGVVVAQPLCSAGCGGKGLAVFQEALINKMGALKKEAGRLSLDMSATGQQLSRFKQKGSCYGKSSDLSPAHLQAVLDSFSENVLKNS